ncbi:MAG: hypothetical protein H0W64_01940 [Gammaproteobacteria bacterium]|nr:hypothetical protein [Gammaproteobacteria bacterium]
MSTTRPPLIQRLIETFQTDPDKYFAARKHSIERIEGNFVNRTFDEFPSLLSKEERAESIETLEKIILQIITRAIHEIKKEETEKTVGEQVKALFITNSKDKAKAFIHSLKNETDEINKAKEKVATNQLQSFLLTTKGFIESFADTNIKITPAEKKVIKNKLQDFQLNEDEIKSLENYIKTIAILGCKSLLEKNGDINPHLANLMCWNHQLSLMNKQSDQVIRAFVGAVIQELTKNAPELVEQIIQVPYFLPSLTNYGEWCDQTLKLFLTTQVSEELFTFKTTAFQSSKNAKESKTKDNATSIAHFARVSSTVIASATLAFGLFKILTTEKDKDIEGENIPLNDYPFKNL